MGFSELKRETGIESSGLLAFHLGKLTGLVRVNSEGSYALTDEGREALRIIEASRKQLGGRPGPRPAVHLPHQKAVLAGLLVILVVLGSVAVYQQEQIVALNNNISSKTVTIDGVRYWYLSVPLQSVLGAKTLVFDRVNFTTVFADIGNYPLGTEISAFNVTGYPSINGNTTFGSHSVTWLPEIAVSFGTGAVEYWNHFTLAIGGKTPLSIAPEHVNITFTDPPRGAWFTQQNHPTAGIGWDETTGIMTFYVSVS